MAQSVNKFPIRFYVARRRIKPKLACLRRAVHFSRVRLSGLGIIIFQAFVIIGRFAGVKSVFGASIRFLSRQVCGDLGGIIGFQGLFAGSPHCLPKSVGNVLHVRKFQLSIRRYFNRAFFNKLHQFQIRLFVACHSFLSHKL